MPNQFYCRKVNLSTSATVAVTVTCAYGIATSPGPVVLADACVVSLQPVAGVAIVLAPGVHHDTVRAVERAVLDHWQHVAADL